MKETPEKFTFDLDQIDEYRKKHNTSVLAIMFTDIEGFTEYTNREGDVAAAKMMAEHDTVLKKAISENDGLIIQKIGDAFLAVFADPSLSVKAALAIQQELKKIKFILNVRIGIHLGQVALVQNLSADIFGNHVNIASRIEALAKGGQILLSRTIYDNVHSWIRSEFIKYKYHGKAKLKGIEGKEDIYQVGMEGDDFTGVESIKQEKINKVFKVSAVAVILIAVSITVTFLFIETEKADFRKSNRKILFEMWSSNLNHLTTFSEKDLRERMLFMGENKISSTDYIDFSRRKPFKDIIDTTLIRELSGTEVKKMYLDFKFYINRTYDAQEIANRFVFEDEMIEKGFLDTFEIGDNIPLHTLQSIGCDAFFCVNYFN